MTAFMEPRDAATRGRATTDFDRNLVVLAGAGTGKTSLLVERILNVVGTGRATLERIAAITFTEKATGELRERLGDALETLRSLAAGEPRPGREKRREAHRAHGWLTGKGLVPAALLERRALEALDALDRTHVSTIHGFCAEILRSHPVETGIDPGFVVDKGDLYAALFEERFRAWLSDELAGGSDRDGAWVALFRDAGIRELRDLARSLGKLGVPLAGSYDPKTGAGPLVTQAGRVHAEVVAALEALPSMPEVATRYLTGARDAVGLAASGDLDAAAAFLRDSGLSSGSEGTPGTAASPREVELFRRTVQDVKPLLKALAGLDPDLTRRALDAVLPFARELQREQRRSGILGFEALLALTAALLRESAQVRDRLRERFSAILVDEFQDTDPLQYDIVLALGDVPGKLFIVGDAKQSIYRFRGADYTAFHHAVERVAPSPEDRLDLTTNFRSVPEVLEPINRLFRSAASGWQESPYQPRYVPIDAAAAEDPARGPRVQIWTVEVAAGLDADSRREAEARVLVDGIRETASADGGTPRWGDILVLLRAFGSVGIYASALRDAGIPFVVRSGRDFYERPEIGSVLATLRALALPEDATALLAYLRSALGGVPDDELARHVAGRRRLYVDAEGAADTPALAAALDRLRELRRRCEGLAVDAQVRAVVEGTSAVPLAAFAFDGAQRVANIETLVARASELARAGNRSLGEILDLLEDEETPAVEGDAPLADEGGNAVRLLTVHSAKGLEAPTVFLVDLAREKPRGPRRETKAEAFADREGALRLRIGDAHDVAWAAAAVEQPAHERAEERRLLYVAMTRAAERLVLLVPPPAASRLDRFPWIDALRAWGYDALALPADGPLADGAVLHRRRLAPEVPASRGSADAIDHEAAEAAYTRSAESLAARALFLRSPSSLSHEPDPEADDTSPLRRDLAQDVGVAVHRALERRAGGAALVVRDPNADVEREARAILEGFESSAFAKRLAEVEVLARELPILLRDGSGVVWRGRADLVVKEPGGGIVVVDYKTDADAAGVVARYRAQVGVYARAIAGALKLPESPRVELWLVRAGTIVPVELDA